MLSKRSVLALLLCLGFLLAWVPAWAGNTHSRPDTQGELQSWWGDLTTPTILPQHCAPVVPSSSLTLAAFACQGYVRGSAGDLVYATQTAHTLGPLTGGDGTYWLALHRDVSTVVANWTRQPGTQYLWRQSTLAVADPGDALQFAQVTVSGGVITTVTRLNTGSSVSRALGEIFVHEYATGGTGTTADPWTGWDTALPWTAGRHYVFVPGVFAYATAPNWAVSGLTLEGAGSALTTLHHTGTGVAVNMDGGASGAITCTGTAMRGFLIQGNASTTDGIYRRACIHGRFDDLRVTDVSQSGLHSLFTVLDTWSSFRVSMQEGAFAVQPVHCLVLDQRVNFLELTTTNVFLNTICEGVSGDGLLLLSAQDTTFVGGTSENNGGAGLLCPGETGPRTGCVYNTFVGMDFEANHGGDGIPDVRIEGVGNQVINGVVLGQLQIAGATAYFNKLQGVRNQGGVSVTYPTHNNTLDGVILTTGATAITDTGVNDTWRNVVRRDPITLITESLSDRTDNASTQRFLGGLGHLPDLTLGGGSGDVSCWAGTIRAGSTMLSGQVSVTTCGTPAIDTAIFTISRHTGDPDMPSAALNVTLTPANLNAAGLAGTTGVYVSGTNGQGFTVNSGAAALTAATTYVWNYFVAE